MCTSCNGNCGKLAGLGNGARPIATKVETFTGPVKLFENTLPTVNLPTTIRTPTIVPKTTFWDGFSNAITGVANFVTSTRQTNNLTQQPQYAVPNDFGFNQNQFSQFQSPTQFQQQQLPRQESGINSGTILKGAAIVGTLIAGVYLLKK